MPSARSENDFSQPREDKVDCPTEGEKENLRSTIKSLGYAGTLAYGFLNTLYYGVGLVIAWIFFCEAPRGLSLREFTKTFMQTAAFTWAGSQLTKGFRAAVAIALAKPVDALIRRTSMKLNVDYGKVVMMYAAACVAAVFACIASLALIWCFK